MNTSTRPFPVSFRRVVPSGQARTGSAARPLATRSSLGDPRFDRIVSRPHAGLWDHALLDRLQSPLTRRPD